MQLEQAPAPSQSEAAHCPRHPALRAKAICARCGSYVCVQCRRLGTDGEDYCQDCHVRAPGLASRGSRFMANLVDSFTLLAPVFLGFFMQFDINNLANEGAAPPSPLFLGLGLLGSFGLGVYQLYLVAQSGQSIGKSMMHIRVLRTDGSPVSVARVLLLRNFVPGLINAFCGIFNFIDALFILGDDKRCLHDMLADTQVVEVPREDVASRGPR